MHHLHPGTRWIFRLNGYGRGIGILFFLTFFSFQILFSDSLNVFGESIAATAITLFFITLFIFVIGSEIYARMTYKFTQTTLKIEKGIIWKKYISLPYERVQNVNIKRGIIARLTGFSTIDLETAGHSGGYQRKRYRSEGHLPGVDIDHAEDIRKFVMDKISSNKKHNSSGV
jgi:membrane protein YdbS with pleckstrin-like domain